MKKAISYQLSGISLVCILLFTGCASLETTAYRTVGTTATVVDTAMNAWGDWVRAGRATAEQETIVRQAYRNYQVAMDALHRVVTAYEAGQVPEAKVQEGITLLHKAADNLVGAVAELRGAPPAPPQPEGVKL